jgi:hypothetical protein
VGRGGDDPARLGGLQSARAMGEALRQVDAVRADPAGQVRVRARQQH